MLKDDYKKIIRAFGLVFGDIGTSPIYTLTVVFLLLTPSISNIMGILSLIFWTMTILVTLEYAWLAMGLGKRGEGGTIVLREILAPLLNSRKQAAFITILTFIGVALLIGDGVITPAISILSAVEGIRLIPYFSNVNQFSLILFAAVIAIILFSYQKKGTEKVTMAFGPVMTIWFLVLAVSGLGLIYQFPEVLKAVNPAYAIKFMFNHGLASFLILSQVILCATGGEALYADMGHLGRIPITKAWSIAFVALILNYFGQGAFLATHPDAKNILFEMVNHQAHFLYIPFLILSILATIIASQAMISGMFSIVYQGITTRIMPMFKVDYTSVEMRTQIYIASVNWFLLASVLLVMFIFKESSHLAYAYGLAVTGTMSITGIMMTWIFFKKKHFIKMSFAVIVTIADLLFLFSNMLKIPQGGYWSIIIALVPFLIILIYVNGQKKLYYSLKPINLDQFLKIYEKAYDEAYRIRGTALFFLRSPKSVPPYISNTMFDNRIIYQDNIFVSINITESPFGIESSFKESISKGLRYFEIQIGYMEVVDIDKILSEAGIYENVIFYGVEDIITENPVWQVFSFIKKITPSFVRFYTFKTNKLHGVITRVEM